MARAIDRRSACRRPARPPIGAGGGLRFDHRLEQFERRWDRSRSRHVRACHRTDATSGERADDLSWVLNRQLARFGRPRGQARVPAIRNTRALVQAGHENSCPASSRPRRDAPARRAQPNGAARAAAARKPSPAPVYFRSSKRCPDCGFGQDATRTKKRSIKRRNQGHRTSSGRRARQDSWSRPAA